MEKCVESEGISGRGFGQFELTICGQPSLQKNLPFSHARAQSWSHELSWRPKEIISFYVNRKLRDASPIPKNKTSFFGRGHFWP